MDRQKQTCEDCHQEFWYYDMKGGMNLSVKQQCYMCADIEKRLRENKSIEQVHCIDCEKLLFLDEAYQSHTDETPTKVLYRCKDDHYRQMKRLRKQQGEEKFCMLYDSEEYLIDY